MTASRPAFSIVTAVYDVERYLPDFIASIEAQAFHHGRIEVIAVDDGSTDGSLALLQAWAGRSPGMVTVLTKPNGGQGSARNLGLEHATGEWVTFTDPDDMLEPEFFSVAARFAAAHPGVPVMAGRPEILDEATGRRVRHPRHRQYARGDRLVDLRTDPNVFPGSTAVSLYKLDQVRATGLRFDPRVQPTFEDGHFAVHYVLGLLSPVVGILRHARYVHRRRAEGTATPQGTWSHPGRYTNVLEHGYLEVLEHARARSGEAPPWLQNVIVYELARYLAEDERLGSRLEVPAELEARFHDLLGRILGHLDPEVVREHRVRRLKPEWVDLLAHAARGRDWHSPVVERTGTDRQMELQRVAYRYAGTPPQEELIVAGVAVRPAYGKTRAISHFGRALLHERIAWLPGRAALEVRLDGASVPISDGPARSGARRRARAAGVTRRRRPTRRHGPGMRLARAARGRANRWRQRLVTVPGRVRSVIATAPLRWLARRWPFGPMYRDAWVLMDRIHDAADNGERLFEHLRAERPDVNAWFVLEKGTPDWHRMRRAGVQRLVAHGSLRWTMLMLNCSWLLSSHSDRAITHPSQILRMTPTATWRFAFLQHGVIHSDLSRWLNGRAIDLLVVSTPAELQSIVADGTGYELTAKETWLTGLPRFDRLLALGRECPPDDRDLVLVAPTWRNWLTEPLAAATQRRTVAESFWESEYLVAWSRILGAPEISAAAARRGWQIGFMPHPNLQSILPQMGLPEHVEPLTFAGSDVQALYARCALLVTDYSSVAFDVAALDRPVVYYQFDRDRMLAGAHVGREGYFSYERDGFGPVARDHRAAVAAIVASIERGPRPAPEHQARIDRTFVNRDGRACARVVEAVEELSRPYLPPTPSAGSDDEGGAAPPTARQSVG